MVQRPRETVTCCGLSQSLLVPARQKQDVIKHITAISTSVSKAVRRGSLFASVHFTRLLEHGLDVPIKQCKTDSFWRQIMLVGSADIADAELSATWQQVQGYIPYNANDRALNDWQSMTYAAQTMKTVFINNIYVPLGNRLTRMCKVFLYKRKTTPVVRVSAAVRAVEDGNVADLPDDVAAFVLQIRAQLMGDSKAALTTAWMKKHLDKVLSFNYWMQKWFQEHGRRGIRLVPLFTVSRKFVKLDTGTLVRILHHCKILTNAEKEVGDSDDDMELDILASYFRAPGARTRTWTGMMDTDGVQANYHSVSTTDFESYRRYKAEAQARKAAGKAAKAAQPEGEVSEAEPDDEPVAERRPLTPAAARKPKVDQLQQLLEARGIRAEDAVVLGVDPGRRNIVYVASRLAKGVTTWQLGARQYYRQSGINTHKRKLQTWHRERQQAWSELGNMRTAATRDVVSYVQAVSALQPMWMDEVLKRRHGRWRARIYNGKRRTVDRFWGGVQRDVQSLEPAKQPVVAYGGASFSASGLGNLTVPTTTVYKSCARIFEVCELQSEYRTSQVCPACHAQVEKVWVDMDPLSDAFLCHGARIPYKCGNVMGITGLLFCPECDKFVNRDKVGSLNIGDNFGRRMRGEPVLEAFQVQKKKRKARTAKKSS